MTDIPALTLSELSEHLRLKQISAVEATRAYLDAIRTHNDRVNAFVTISEDDALAAAEQAQDEIQKGNYRGPLHGVPIGHKDLYWTKGVRTTAGSRLREDFIPDRDATVVAQYRAAGAVMLGKLNTHEFAYGPTGENSMFGPSRNPWNPDRISGGSSGGSGAAVKLGMCAAATGSDTGGSIRIPAACCGTVGLKPTYGRASRYGIFPLCWSMDHPGPLTRTVRDAALMLQPIAGHDPNDPATVEREVPDYVAGLRQDLKGMRVGIPSEYFYDRADPETEAAVRAAVQTMAGLGADVREVEIAHIQQSAAAALTIYLAEACAYHDDTQVSHADLYTDQVRTFIELGNYVLAKDYLHAQRYRRLLGSVLADVLSQCDVLVTPTLPVTATPIGQETINIRGVEQTVFAAMLRNTEPFNLAGLPALAVPCGFSNDGLPISLQIVGRPFAEATVLGVGHAYQEATDWHTLQPQQ